MLQEDTQLPRIVSKRIQVHNNQRRRRRRRQCRHRIGNRQLQKSKTIQFHDSQTAINIGSIQLYVYHPKKNFMSDISIYVRTSIASESS
jgi:hypothetical protein